MKRTAFLVAGLALLGAAVYVSTLWAQPARPAAQPTTKVGLLNITYVIKHYNKYKTYSEDLKATVAKYQAKDTEWKTKGEKLAKDRAAPNATDAQKDAIDRELKNLERMIEDNKNEAQKAIVKKQDEQIKILYGDVRDVVAKYAQSNGFEMVLHYHEPLTNEEYYSAANYARKMQIGALMPIYYAGGLEISPQVLEALNKQVPAAAAPPAGQRK